MNKLNKTFVCTGLFSLILFTFVFGLRTSRAHDGGYGGQYSMNMSQLQQLASAERMIPNAPIQASSKIVVSAPVATVWAIATNVSAWPTWYDYLKNAQVQGAFVPGAKLSYGGMIKHDLAIAKITDRKLVMIYGKLLGYTGITRWDFKQISPGQTEVTFTESSDGFLIGALYSNEKLEQHLSEWLTKLKARSEKK